MRDDEGQEYETPPDPADGMPDGWDPKLWEGYRMMWAGATLREVGYHVERSSGTVSGWRKRWREKYGPGLFAEQAKANTEARQADIASQEPARKWREHRTNLADLSGRNGDKMLVLLEQLLARFTKQVEQGQEVSMADITGLVAAIDRISVVADRLTGIPDPTKAARWQQHGALEGPHGAPVARGVVAALEGRTAPGASARDTLAAAKLALVRVQSMRADAIEVTEAPAG